MRISVVIITRNEERHIARCLSSVAGVTDESIVVDSGSSDRTREIATSLGSKVFRRDWTNYSEQKNFGASQASHDWILSLDADECLSDSLRQRLQELKRAGPQAEAYSFPRKPFYLGRWIMHSGWYPDPKIRLYQRGRAAWTGEYVHESLIVQGEIHRIDADILHYTCDSIGEHLARLDRYTDLAAEEMWQKREESGPARWLTSPGIAFISSYFIKAGFLDGPQGLLIALFAGYYNFLKYAKLWEKWRQRSNH